MRDGTSGRRWNAWSVRSFDPDAIRSPGRRRFVGRRHGCPRRRDATCVSPSRLLDNPKRFSSAARNIGMPQLASGRYLVIVDGHCAHSRSALSVQNGRRHSRRAAPTASGDRNRCELDGASPFQEAVAVARESWLGHNPDSDIYSDRPRFVPPDNVAVAYKREVFEKVGLFDEQFDACEDVEFNTRVRQAGLTCFFTPAIRADYQPRGTLQRIALPNVPLRHGAVAAGAEASCVDYVAEPRSRSLADLAASDLRARVRIASLRWRVLRVAVAVFVVDSRREFATGDPQCAADARCGRRSSSSRSTSASAGAFCATGYRRLVLGESEASSELTRRASEGRHFPSLARRVNSPVGLESPTCHKLPRAIQ